MAVKYLESFGENGYVPWSEREVRGWCSCHWFREFGSCRHMFWFRGQVTVRVDERFL